MAIEKIKGHEFNVVPVKDSFTRRAQRFYNNIVTSLRAIGVIEDDIYIDIEPVAIKRLPASATWYVDGYRLHYSYKAGLKYVDNLFIISKVIECEVKDILAGEKSIEQFIFDFSEADEVEEERREARELIGVAPDCIDLDEINIRYKALAKKAHPDMPTGDTETFKALNRAHKILKRELE